MSRSGDKKPVGFAMHITAGGIAGACEAVSLTIYDLPNSVLTRVLPKS